MEVVTISLFMVIAIVFVLMIGMPVSFALGIVSVATMYLFLPSIQFDSLADHVFSSLNDLNLLAIPLFVLMGAAFAGSKAGSDLFDAAFKWLSGLTGGLAISTVAASALFAALSGASGATAAAIGKVAIPEMQKRGYSDSIAAGSVAAGGTLGILIPPSVTLILYGVAVEESIGDLFMAGIIPGILITIMFSVWIYIATKLEKKKSQLTYENTINSSITIEFSWKERFKSFLQVIPFISLLVVILVALYGGLATPGEAAGFGAIAAFAMVIITYRSLTWKKFINILLESTRESTMILLIMVFSSLVGTVLSFLSIPQDLANFVAELDMNKWVIMLFINLFLLVLGCFLLPVAIIVMTAPILYPIITTLGFDPIWFGIIMTINMEMGLITPPVGLNLFIVKGVAKDIPTPQILKGSIPFLLIIGFSIILFSFFPEIITWLPKLFA